MLKPLRLLWPPVLIGAIRSSFRQVRNSGSLTRDWARSAAQRLVDEGSLDPEEAEKAISGLETPETVAALGHFGAHIAITLVLFTPFENIARFAWTVSFRLRAEATALIRRGSDERLRGARKIHTLTVAAASLVPFVGAFAYLVAEPIRRNRPLLAVLLDQGLRKLPFGLYRRQHLAVLTCWLACSGPGVAPRMVKSRWHSLRPHHLVAWVTESVERLRPHRTLVTSILAANAVALAVAAIVGGLAGWLSETFGEFGPVKALSAVELLLAGVAGYYIYTRFWRLPQAGQRVDAPGSFFWILSGAGLVWLGIDDYFGIREQVGDAIQNSLGLTTPLVGLDDLILVGYAIIGLTVVAIFLAELMRSRAAFPLLVTGIGFLIISQAADIVAPDGTALAGIESPTGVIGAGFLLTAYLVKLREVWNELPAVPEPSVAGGPPSEP